ncbi:MAG: YadA-like family protein [Pseudoxanthomonas sp.]
MNHIYRLVWCRSRNVMVVASELAASGKRGGRSCVGATFRLVSLSTALWFSLSTIPVFAQSTGDARLADLLPLVAKYAQPSSTITSHPAPIPKKSLTAMVDAAPAVLPGAHGRAIHSNSSLSAKPAHVAAVAGRVIASNRGARAVPNRSDRDQAPNTTLPGVQSTAETVRSEPVPGSVKPAGKSNAVVVVSEAVADRRRRHDTKDSTGKPSEDNTSDGDSRSSDEWNSSPENTLGGAWNARPMFPMTGLLQNAFGSIDASSSASSASAQVIVASQPVVPVPGPAPTGIIVGNGGVVGTVTQLLGPTANSLFGSPDGYVSNGSLHVSNVNFAQGYSTLNLLGLPVLNLTPVGTLLTSTGGTLVVGTGIDSHLTLVGGVTSNSYIDNINNGGAGGLLGIVLPGQVPAWASTCLNVLGVLTESCWGLNAAQDYQVLVGDGASANGSKEVVIGTGASHTLPTVDANTAFPGAGTNDPNNPSGVPTADYEARLGHSVVIGDDASGTADAQTILGAEATSSVANSVALGYRSVASRGAQIGYIAFGLATLQTSAGEVSVGAAGKERQITNVAAGSAATDAVNVAQLEGVSTLADNAVQYDDAGRAIVTLSGIPSVDGGVTGGTTITNLHQGALNPASTDAVNGAQLYATNQNITTIYATGTKYFQANSTGAGSIALGADSIAAGVNSQAISANSIAVGNGAIAGDPSDLTRISEVAIGNNAKASAQNTIAIGDGSLASGPQSTAVGSGAQATAAQASAFGRGAVAGNNATALGMNANAAALRSTAVGQGAIVSASDGTALGQSAQVTAAGGVALGRGSIASTLAGIAGYIPAGASSADAASINATTSTLGAVSVADATGGQYRQITGVAAGTLASDAVNVAQLQAVDGQLLALDSNAVQYDIRPDGSTNYNNVTLAGAPSTDGGATGGTSIGNVHQGALSATSTDAVNGAQLYATNSSISNIYDVGTKYFQANSTGTGSSAVGTDSVAVGMNAQALNAGDVALGAGSSAGAAHSGTTIFFGGTAAGNASSVLSIGAAGVERQLQNVAPGVVAASSTDAINGSQLYSVVSGVNALGTSVATSLGGGSTFNLGSGTVIADLNYGGATYGSVQGVLDALTGGGTGAGIKYFHVHSTLGDGSASGTDSVAIGPLSDAGGVDSVALGNGAAATANNAMAFGAGANASMANSIALGAGSTTLVGAMSNYAAYGLTAPQTSAGEINVGNRQVTGVAAGSAANDAVNVAQLQAVDDQVQTVDQLSVKYDAGPGGQPTNTVTLTGDNTGASVRITQVAVGAETSVSTDAVNGSQLWHWTQDVNNIYSNYSLYNDIQNISPGGGGSEKYFHVHSTLADSSATGANSVAIGPVATASGSNSVAMGNGASASADNAVAIGAGSVADRADTVSVGSVGSTRQIINVAAGTATTDAVNVGQLAAVVTASENGTVHYDQHVDGSVDYNNVTLGNGDGATSIHNVAAGVANTDAVNTGQLGAGITQAVNWANAYTDQQIERLGNRANAGVAAAMAMGGLPQAYEPGKSMAAVAAGSFRGESSLAIGISTISEGGRWVYKLTGSTDTRGDTGVSIGAGMQW